MNLSEKCYYNGPHKSTLAHQIDDKKIKNFWNRVCILRFGVFLAYGKSERKMLLLHLVQLIGYKLQKFWNRVCILRFLAYGASVRKMLLLQPPINRPLPIWTIKNSKFLQQSMYFAFFLAYGVSERIIECTLKIDYFL